MRILYLDIDTLRPDHLGCYGYHRNTSPHIDSIASEGMRFDNYYCTDAPCLPSRAAMMTGQFGIHNGIINHGGTCADRPPDGPDRQFFNRLRWGGSCAHVMRDAGMHTAYIGGFPERHSAYWYYAGFHEAYDTAKYGMESAEDVSPIALDWIEKNADNDDWYLHINYWDPHTPYRAPDDFGNPFKDEPTPDWMTEEILDKHWKHTGPHSAQDFAMYDNSTNPQFPRQPGEVKGMDGWRKAVDGYDCGIRYADSHVGNLLNALDKKGVLDDLMIIVSSDHGENFGELGIYGEHGTADNTTCRIPFIVRWPGKVQPGTSTDALIGNVDFLPTLADITKRPHHDFWDGRSFINLLLTGEGTGRDDLVISQCCHVCQRSVRWANYIYMRTYHDGFHLFPQEMVYDLEADPHEQNNIAEEHPELCREGAWRLLKWHDEMMHTQPLHRPTDPMQIVLKEGGPCHARGRLKEYITRLEETGRGDVIPELKRRHPREFE